MKRKLPTQSPLFTINPLAQIKENKNIKSRIKILKFENPWHHQFTCWHSSVTGILPFFSPHNLSSFSLDHMSQCVYYENMSKTSSTAMSSLGSVTFRTKGYANRLFQRTRGQ